MSLAEAPQQQHTETHEFIGVQNVIAELVNFAVLKCLSPELLERQTNFTKLYDERYAPIAPNVRLELGRLGADGPFTYINNVEHIRNKTSVGLGATIGRNCIIKEEVRIGSGAKIGDFCLIAHHAVIGDNAEIATGVSVEYGIYVQENQYVEPGAVVTEWQGPPCDASGALEELASRLV